VIEDTVCHVSQSLGIDFVHIVPVRCSAEK
jgi:hypothetical protein